MTLGNNLGEHLGKHLLGEYQIYLWALCDLLWLLGNPRLLAIPVTYLATSVSDRHPVLPRFHSLRAYLPGKLLGSPVAQSASATWDHSRVRLAFLPQFKSVSQSQWSPRVLADLQARSYASQQNLFYKGCKKERNL